MELLVGGALSPLPSLTAGLYSSTLSNVYRVCQRDNCNHNTQPIEFRIGSTVHSTQLQLCILCMHTVYILVNAGATVLCDVGKIRPLVTEQVDFALTLASDPFISFTSIPLLIFSNEHEVGEDTPAEQKYDQVSEYHAVTGSKGG